MMIAASFSRESLIESFVVSGMIDSQTKTCADLYGLINSFKIDWLKIKGGKQWFIDTLPVILKEMFLHGEISESFYDKHNFPLDCDHVGNV